MNSRITNYLAKYGQTDLPRFIPSLPFDQGVVIPVLAERSMITGCIRALAEAAEHAKTSAIAIVIVNSDSAARADWKEDNRKLLEDYEIAEAGLVNVSGNLSLFIVDKSRTGREFPLKQGVGRARKLGADLALHWIAEGKLLSPWVRNTDADARVALDYFNYRPDGDLVAGLSPYAHLVKETPEELPVALYEIYLRYYELGLRFAGSPYAFPTIGSLISFDANAYAMVRGFPLREAGEDFYFLNKLRKVGRVASLPGNPVQLLARRNVRVPFGTTKSQLSIEASLATSQPYRIFDPEIFRHLRAVIQALQLFTLNRDLGTFQDGLTIETKAAWHSLHGDSALESALRERKTSTTLAGHLTDWFDAFRTLKFIHFLSEQYYPKVPWEEAIGRSPFVPKSFTSPWELLRQLRRFPAT